MKTVNKTGLEVLTEVETIIVNLQGMIDALCLIDNTFNLDSEPMSDMEKIYLAGNYQTIRNIHNLVECGLYDIIEKIDAIKLTKKTEQI